MSRASSSSAADRVASSAWSAPRQNTLPITAASSSAPRAAAGSVSSRAAIVVRTFVGSSSVASSTRSASEATSSSMNSGLPSAVITTRSAAPRSRRRSIGRRCPASVRASSAGQRIQLHRGVRRQPRSPGRPGVEELGAGQGQEHDRDVADPGGQGLQEVQLAGVGPVDVLEHQQERLPARQLLHEPAGREKSSGWRSATVSPPRPIRRARWSATSGPSVGTAELGDDCCQLRPASAGGSLSKIPATSLTCWLERPVPRGLAVREGSSPQHSRPGRLDQADELAGQAGLPDARRPDHGHQVGASLGGHALPGVGAAAPARRSRPTIGAADAARSAGAASASSASQAAQRLASCPWPGSARAGS